MRVPFVDLGAQHKALREDILRAWVDVLDSTRFIASREVAAFEYSFASAHGVDHCAAVGTGTDALFMILLALGVGPGDAVVVPANTFIATAEAVSLTGAAPYLVDCDPVTRNIDVEAAGEAMKAPHVRGAIAVHLYGQPADMNPLTSQAANLGGWVIEDAAQAHLARYRGDSIGGLGRAAAFSFYPSKNLGAPGEGGAVLTNDPTLADTVRAIRDHGQRDKHRSHRMGYNGRMHELVGATLNVKLPHLAGWTENRRSVAERYRALLEGHEHVTIPDDPAWAESVYHLYVVHVPHRDRVMKLMIDAGIGVGLHYPTPIHLQEAYRHLGHTKGDFPHAESSASSLLSLPMFPELTTEAIEYVAENLMASVNRAVDEATTHA